MSLTEKNVDYYYKLSFYEVVISNYIDIIEIVRITLKDNIVVLTLYFYC